MATDKEIKLVEQLLDKTRKRILSWEPTAQDDEFISTFGGNVSFSLNTGRAKDEVGRFLGRATEVLVMRDERDRVLLRIDSDDVTEISQLYVEARRQALKVDESLDDVLEQLTKLDRR